MDLSDNAAHILIVDDDQGIRDRLARYLLENGFRVATPMMPPALAPLCAASPSTSSSWTS
jgi:DNA-binding NtrC family response regulator